MEEYVYLFKFALVARVLLYSSQVVVAFDKDILPENQRKHNRLWAVIIRHVL